MNQSIFKLILWSFTVVSITSTALAKNVQRKPSGGEDRPPQYVLLAFDGSLNLSFWRESVVFADTVSTLNNQNQAAKLKFTYFINPVYYLEAKNKDAYSTPGLDRPVSCIGWSTPANSFGLRIQATNKAFDSGHEIGSHANSHCDASGRDSNNPMYGHPWSEANWTSEFEQFNKLLFGAFQINGAPPQPISFTQENIKGFRAPLLAVTDGLWPTLKKFNFRYDTSKTSAPTYWPQRMSWGGWNFPLAQIKIAGTTKKTLSMDYNWLCAQTACATKPNLSSAERERLKKQMLDSYKYYFKINYFGGRGPIHIGHHFSQWNQGIYWQAMKEFAHEVCRKPEVRCVTYSEYANFLDGLSSSQYEKYRSGQFEKLPDDQSIQDIATPLLAEIRLDMGNDAFEAMVADSDLNKMKVTGWSVQLKVNFEPQAQKRITRTALVEKVGRGSKVLVRASLVNKTGVELDWTTYRINQLGTDQEQIEGPLENRALEGEGLDAHNIPD